jgi:hypothetical protein
MLTLDPEAIAARICEAVPPEKADKIVAALNQRLVHWRVGTFDPRHLHVTEGAPGGDEAINWSWTFLAAWRGCGALADGG